MANKKKPAKTGKPNPKTLVAANPPKCIYSPLEGGKFSDTLYKDIQEMISDDVEGNGDGSIDCIVFVPVKVVRIKNEVTIKDL